MHPQPPTQALGALAHVRQANATAGVEAVGAILAVGAEAAAVVFNDQPGFVRVAFEGELQRRRLRMPFRIGQRFLGDAVQGHGLGLSRW